MRSTDSYDANELWRYGAVFVMKMRLACSTGLTNGGAKRRGRELEKEPRRGSTGVEVRRTVPGQSRYRPALGIRINSYCVARYTP
jgi:hypothetical protein